MNCSQAAIELRLKALQCPIPPDPTDALLVQKQICWLEDAYIRRYAIADRAALRKTDYHSALNAYLRLLDAPVEAHASPISARNFLLDLAIDLHYEDHAALFNTPFDPWHSLRLPVVPGVADSPIVSASLQSLRDALELPDIENVSSADVAAAAADAVEALTRDDLTYDTEQSIDDLPAAFDTDDKQIERVTCVMRLLYVRRLRALQDEVNSIISEMQAITANPSTDAELGKVGR
ncbi:RNA transcription translation and transport factor protein [Gracilaria domingensis]|nr:RNA transcription translation and transport factor protein [Gracilaria domingensis]